MNSRTNECDAVLIFFGKARDKWLQSTLRELKKAPGNGRDKPFLSKAVLCMDPQTPGKKMLMMRDPVILKSYGGFKESELHSFIDNLK